MKWGFRSIAKEDGGYKRKTVDEPDSLSLNSFEWSLAWNFVLALYNYAQNSLH